MELSQIREGCEGPMKSLRSTKEKAGDYFKGFVRVKLLFWHQYKHVW